MKHSKRDYSENDKSAKGKYEDKHRKSTMLNRTNLKKDNSETNMEENQLEKKTVD